MYVCTCMYVHVCNMYVYMYVCMYVCMSVCMYVCMYVHVCMKWWMYVCMYIITNLTAVECCAKMTFFTLASTILTKLLISSSLSGDI